MVGPQRALPRAGDGDGAKRPRGSAKDRALGLLAARWRSRRELEMRLRAAGFDDVQVSTALQDLQRAGLIDDGRFARELARAKSDRLDGNRTVRSALAKAGVASQLTEEVVAELGDEGQRAYELAERRAARMAGLPVEVAHRRLLGLLLRRGYRPDLARDAARRALAGLADQEFTDP